MSQPFAPLRIISGYSFLQSGLTMEKIAASIKKNDFYGAALADNGVLYGVPSFIEEMEKLDKKYVIGLAIHLDFDYVLYAINEDGYKNLIALSEMINEDKLENKDLDNHLNGTILVVETNNGRFLEEFREGLSDSSLHRLAKLSSLSEDFYLGLEVTSKDEFRVAQNIREFALNHTYKCLAFPKIKYQKKEDAIILTIVNAIEKDEKIETKEEVGQSYFMNFENYRKLYTAEEILATTEIIDKSTFNYHQKRGEIAHFDCENAAETLKNKAYKGLKDKNINDKEHLERLKYELDVICSMGYEDYFLIVSDYVNYARNHDILVGPGRGSAAGSLVSYALDITEVDPLEYDLLFERFLNKARKSMPDIDVDFMDTKKEDMIQYMRDKYGNDKVANIATFQTIQAKQSLRDIGRIYNYPTRHIDMLCKTIIDKASNKDDKLSLREAYKKLPAFRNIVDSDKYFLEIVSLASKIEKLPRQSGLHAAGIILNNQPINEALPVTTDFDGHYTSQYEKDYLEEQGFLKMDFLSLRNLTTIDLCLKLIKKNHHLQLDAYHLPYKDDPNIFKIIASEMTAGIFQLESSGMKNAIRILKPNCFNDVYTLLAIFRPGPMDNIKEFAARKSGKKPVTYLNKDLEKILAPTYGILVYQEQISSIAITMAGFTPSEADLFRRAVPHKEKAGLEAAQKNFLSGALKKGYKVEEAKKVFNDILKFADYGFNKSHAVVYAMIACRMTYLKYYYPLEFYIALLTTSSGASDSKFGEYVSELKRRDLKIYLPDINASGLHFIAKDGGLLFPLSFIKGISSQVVHKIIDERALNGNYRDFFDFVKRCFILKIGAESILKFINAGALDVLYPSRATLRKTLDYALQFAELSYNGDGQLILDDSLENQKQYFTDYDDPLENLNNEYETLGIMLSNNPLRYKKDLIDNLRVENLIESENKSLRRIVGIISSIKIIKTKKRDENMAFVKIFDEYSECEVTIFPRVYNESYTLLNKNNIIVVDGHYEEKDEKKTFIADKITSLEGE